MSNRQYRGERAEGSFDSGSGQGFENMDEGKQRNIASKGGRAMKDHRDNVTSDETHLRSQETNEINRGKQEYVPPSNFDDSEDMRLDKEDLKGVSREEVSELQEGVRRTNDMKTERDSLEGLRRTEQRLAQEGGRNQGGTGVTQGFVSSDRIPDLPSK
eukprot:GILJ01018570.1.p1 GENE.GILJ01018570.1~~GILJ01018570.1.p1  ORF type:complete len:158 (-),score=26.31 GILJ01018570.1:96-569(-)